MEYKAITQSENKFFKQFILFLVLSTLTLASSQSRAIIVSTYDSSNNIVPLEQRIVNNPDNFLDQIQLEFKQGNLAEVGQYLPQLRKALPENPIVISLSAIYLITINELSLAEKELSLAKKLQPDNFYALIAEAMLLQRKKAFSQAEKTIQQAIKTDENHPYPWNVSGRIYFEQEKYQKALGSFQKSVTLNKLFQPGYLNLGATHYLLNNFDAAITDFIQAIRLNPNSDKAHLGIALVYEVNNQPHLALMHLNQSIQLNQANANTDILPNIAALQLKNGLYQEARETALKIKENNLSTANFILADVALHTGNIKEALNILAAMDQRNTRVSYLQALCYMVMQDYSRALRFMEKITAAAKNKHFGAYTASLVLKMNLGVQIEQADLFSQNWPEEEEKFLHFISATLLAEQGKTQQALNEYQNAAGMIAGFSAIGLDKKALLNAKNKKIAQHISLGVLFYYNNLLEPALTKFNSALQKVPDSVMANFWSAQIFMENRIRDRAILMLKKVIKTAPKFFPALYSLAELNLLSGNTNEAIKYYEQALAVKKNFGITLKLGMLYENKKKYEAAEKYYQELIKLNPELYIGYNQLAWMYAKRNVKLDKAMELVQKADKLLPGNKGISDTYGWIYYHMNDYDKALEYISKAIEIDANDPVVLYHLGAVQFAMGDTQTAKRNLQRAFSIAGDFEGADAARELLQR